MASLRFPQLDGMDVTERPMTSADSRAFAQQPGPGNPNVGPEGSVEARAFRAGPPNPATVPGAANASLRNPSLLARGSERAGKLAGKGLRVLGPAAAGADIVSHFNDYKIDDPSVDSSAKGTWNALRQGDFSGAGRSLSKGALETGMDLGSAAANIADIVVPGKAPVSTAYHGMLRDTFGDQLKPHGSVPVLPAAPTLRTQPTFSPNDQSQAETSRLLRQNSAPPAFGPTAEPSPFGTFQKASLRDFGTVDQNAEAQRAAAGRAVFAKDKALADSMQAEREAKDQAGFAAQDRSVQVAQGLQAKVDQERALKNAETSATSIAGTEAEKAWRRAQVDKVRDQGTNLTNQGFETQRAATKLASDQQLAKMGNQTTLRGQDLSYDSAIHGHNSTAASNRARMMYDIGKDQRDFAAQRSDKAFDQRETYAKDTRAKLESMFTTKDSDGKSVVDKDAVASHEAGITAHIGNLIAAAEKRGDAATADALRQKGAAAMGEDGLQKLITQLEVKRRSQAGHSGWNPLAGNHVDSADPSDYDVTGIKRGILQDQYVTRNGSQVRLRDLDYSKGGSSILPNGMADTPTQRFQIIKQPKLREF
jgi:hypothetical protein